MILNIDLNPGIRRDIYVESLEEGGGNPIESSIISMEGSAGNIAYFLSIFGVDSRTTGFLGSYNRQLYYQLLGGRSEAEFIEIKDRIFERLNIIDRSKSRSTYFQEEVKITKDEITDFINNYHSLLDYSSYLLLSDNLNSSLTEGLYRNLLRIAKIKEKPMVLEASKVEMLEIVEEGPEILIPSLDLLSSRSNLILNNRESIAASANYFLGGDTRTILVNLFEEGLLALSQGRVFYLEAALADYIKRENHGLMAGIAISLDRGYDLETMLKLAQACNIAHNSTSYAREIDLFQIKKEMAGLEIYEL